MKRHTASSMLAQVQPSPNGCWELSQRKVHHTGYVLVIYQGRQYQAHRLIYGLLGNVIPDGLELDHLCRNRACVRPDHLEPVTHLENVRRGSLAQATHCKSGHEFTPENTKRQRAGYRQCRECHRLDGKRRYWQRKAAAA